MVPRETGVPPPSLLADLFSERAPQARQYAGLLRGPGVQRGLIGPREGPRIWQRHILNCAAISGLFPAGSRLCDVGSGAGLPGIVVALGRPDLSVTLLEPLLRRVTFLQETVAALMLDNVVVVRGRAEQQIDVQRFEAVTARAVAPLDTLARWCLPLLVPGGELVAMRGAQAHDEVASTREALAGLGVAAVSIETYGARFVQPPTTVVRLQSGSTDQP